VENKYDAHELAMFQDKARNIIGNLRLTALKYINNTRENKEIISGEMAGNKFEIIYDHSGGFASEIKGYRPYIAKVGDKELVQSDAEAMFNTLMKLKDVFQDEEFSKKLKELNKQYYGEKSKPQDGDDLNSLMDKINKAGGNLDKLKENVSINSPEELNDYIQKNKIVYEGDNLGIAPGSYFFEKSSSNDQWLKVFFIDSNKKVATVDIRVDWKKIFTKMIFDKTHGNFLQGSVHDDKVKKIKEIVTGGEISKEEKKFKI